MEFTTSQFRQNLAKAYNAAQSEGKVKIKHRDRPDMFLITQAELDKIKKQEK